MPKFRNVITGLAISTVMTGGALALGATTAHAATPGTPTISSNWGHGSGHCGRRGRGCRNTAVNRNDFRFFKFEKEKKVNRKNTAFASGDAVIEIDGDDDD
ncbi:hypothetical protein [Microbispora bryophytorum]|uniref:Uncharacterized protein n=1 Tax=Microbispora bryophytorum TaxID=1460882 RepID=A0A8H9H0S3_9ACTN|nr:hypothetical protein [Microbispora bryophytorum]MBD3136744.1 hypothetical protein [Microbispora bryophytorum]TQS06325.1 hypothetical protein FLX07_14865 [Microbispora bryophytorum]GGO17376.1 hypothetical protein GCM10011574_40890 [Microbispora bryophytorum]